MDDDLWEFIQHVEDDANLPLPRMIIRDMENPLERHSPLELLDRYRFSRYTIQNIILPMVYPNANMNNGNRGLPIPPIFKLCCALRFFATGSYQRVCGDLVGLSQPSASRVVKEVAENLAMHLHRHITFPEVHRANVMAFYRIAQFPGVIGCVDGTHIEIRSPGGANPEVYRNRKGWMSLNVQVVAGPQCQILDIVIRWPGSTHDSRIFTNSAVCMRLGNGTLQGIILADSAYAQTRNVYTPLRNPRTQPEIRYNNAHKRTRNVVERTFGIWKGRFRCIHNCLNSDIRTATRIIAATAVLHNIAINQREAHNAGNIREIAVPNFPQVRDHQHVRGNVIRAAFIQRHFR